MTEMFLLLPMLGFCFRGHSVEWNSFEWGKSKSEWSSSKQLRDRWVASLLQECMRSKLEKEFIALGIQYEIQAEEGWLPCRLFGAVLADEGYKIAGLEDARQGNILDLSIEFDVAQVFWSQWILEQRKESAPLEWLSEPPFESSFSYADFLQQSEEILRDVSLMDLVIAFNSFGNSAIEGVGTFTGESFAAHYSYLPSRKGWEPAPGVERGGEPKSEEAKLFFDLPLTEEDKKIIRQIVTTMAEKNFLQLFLEKKSLERKGDQIQPVHPLRFAGYVLTDPVLRRSMRLVSQSRVKWNGFLDGYEKRLKEEKHAGTLDCYVPGLADLLEVDRSIIQRYINQENYSGLIKHFL